MSTLYDVVIALLTRQVRERMSNDIRTALSSSYIMASASSRLCYVPIIAKRTLEPPTSNYEHFGDVLVCPSGS